MDITQMEIVPAVYDHVHERTSMVIAKESVLYNFALIIQQYVVNLDRFKSHVDSMFAQGISRKPTWSYSFNTEANNALDYLIGEIVLTVTSSKEPVFKCAVYSVKHNRSYDESLRDWIETKTLEGINVELILNQASSLKVRGSAFEPADLRSGVLTSMMIAVAKQLEVSLSELPIFEAPLSEMTYMGNTLRALSSVSGVPTQSMWSLLGWDIGIPQLQLK